jgi:hypothetical protein
MVVCIARDHGQRLPPPPFLHRVEIRPVLHQRRGEGMPQVMKPQVRESGLASRSFEGAPEITRPDACAFRITEYTDS